MSGTDLVERYKRWVLNPSTFPRLLIDQERKEAKTQTPAEETRATGPPGSDGGKKRERGKIRCGDKMTSW